jgi:hypothetical protein
MQLDTNPGLEIVLPSIVEQVLPDEFELEVKDQDIEIAGACGTINLMETCGISQALKRKFGPDNSFWTLPYEAGLGTRVRFNHNGRNFVSQFDTWIGGSGKKPKPTSVKFTKIKSQGT